MTFASIIAACESFLITSLKANDPSHDWLHIDRVRSSALSLAFHERVNERETLFVIEMGALLHDSNDWKLKDQQFDVLEWLTVNGLTDFLLRDRIMFIINYCSYRKQLRNTVDTIDGPLEAKIVRDADRLDAMGAIGIARAFSYGGIKKRLLYHPDRLDVLLRSDRLAPTEEEYIKTHNAQDSTTLDHFADKLLRLSQLMETSMGKHIAKSKHNFMVEFVTQMQREIMEPVILTNLDEMQPLEKVHASMERTSVILEEMSNNLAKAKIKRNKSSLL